MINSEVMAELEKVVGEKYVSDRPEEQFLYHYDFVTAEPEGTCDIAIIPNSAEEVQEIVKIANKYKNIEQIKSKLKDGYDKMVNSKVQIVESNTLTKRLISTDSG